ncbi:MAG: DJ-1/PfpI family protein [Burkholderiales bacterium]|nr:DJ-1/PfpI family protein [Burkholderiales bacterium]
MKAALVVFDGMTMLDFIGFYDAITRLPRMGFMPEFTWSVCARTAQVSDERGLRLLADRTGESLEGCDLLFVPGGMGTRTLQHDAPFVEWLRSASAARYKVSVCTGALLLGAAGYLRGLSATTHPSALDELKPYCAKVLRERIVDQGPIVTGGGVSTSIDLGLYLVERLAGTEAREKIARQMDYPYTPQGIVKS